MPVYSLLQSSTPHPSLRFEVTSLVGTLCPDGLHLHITVADKDGTSFGGHLMEGMAYLFYPTFFTHILLQGCIIYTTAEIVIGVLDPWYTFTREIDEQTGYDELIST